MNGARSRDRRLRRRTVARPTVAARQARRFWVPARREGGSRRADRNRAWGRILPQPRERFSMSYRAMGGQTFDGHALSSTGTITVNPFFPVPLVPLVKGQYSARLDLRAGG